MRERRAVETAALLTGNWTIDVLVIDGRSQPAEFLDSLASVDAKRLDGLLRRVGSSGPPKNIQKNRKLDDDIWELKSFQQRLLYFRAGARRIVITNGFTKKQQKTPAQEIERAKRLLAEYRSAKGV